MKMKTAVIYASSHGTAEKVAEKIQNGLGGEGISTINLKTNKNIDLSLYDNVVIGGSIHAGSVQGCVKEFCKKNMVDLLQKKIALYVCAMNEPEYEQELKGAFPEMLFNYAICKKVVGGEFNFDKMNFLERVIVKKVSGISETTEKIDHSAIDEIVAAMK
jgi:menaquinone-dependent protoporphyrinogen oxidase